MRAAWNDFKSKMIVPKCFNAPEVVAQAYWIFHEFADRKDERFKGVFTAKYEADGGKYVPAGGDEFKQVAVIVWSLELDAMIALFEKAWKEMGDGQYGDARPFLVVVEMADGTKELQVGDFGARMFFTGLSGPMHKAYGAKFDAAPMVVTAANDMFLQETIYVSCKGMKQGDFLTGGSAVEGSSMECCKACGPCGFLHFTPFHMHFSIEGVILTC